MNPVAVNPTLAHLLEVQAALLDAYLSQNLGKRFAYVIYVVPTDLSGPVAGVSNCHAPLVEEGADFAVRQLAQLTPGAVIEVDATPRTVQGLPRA
jgi:hypothetical protein